MDNNLFSSLPNTLMGWVAVLTVVVVGGVAVYGIWDRKAKERKKEVDDGEDRLIDILQKTVTELEGKVNKQTDDIKNLTQQVELLNRDNKNYIDIFRGRDEQTQQFYKQGFESMKITQENHDLLTTVATSIQNTNDNMTKLIDILGKHVQIIDHATSAIVK